MADNEGQEAQSESAAPAPQEHANDSGAVKALRSEREARKNAETTAKELAEKVRQFEDNQKTAEEKLTETATAAESRANDFEARAMRAEVALDMGLAPALAARLTGTTRDELEADAVTLSTLIGETAKPRKPQPDHALGRSESGGTTTADAFAAAISNLL